MTKEEKALELRREYSRNYRKTHLEQCRNAKRKWNKEYPEKNKQYQRDYWLRKAQKALEDEAKK